jgi:hypothetical protein
MTVVLDKDVERLVAEQASMTGGSANVLVNESLRFMLANLTHWKEWPPEIEAWLMESVESPVTPLTASDYDEIREQTRKKLGAVAA